MKKLIASVIVGVLFFCASSFAQSDFTASDLASILETDWHAYKSGKENFDGGLAMQILSPKGDYFIKTDMDVTNTTHFRIASVTKTFTAAGIMLLNQKGLLNINDKITDNIPGTNTPYLPDTPEYNVPYKKDITIRMLLMHRAGIFDVSNNNIPDNQSSHDQPYVNMSYLGYMKDKDKEHEFTFDELVGVVARNQLSFFEPGSNYHYSDTGYSMLGKIIERVSGMPYADFIKEELLAPNGLLNISLPWKGSDQAIPEPFIKGYVWMKGEIEEVTISNMTPHVAEGNVISNAIDLANWCKKLMTGNAGLTKETVEMMKSGMTRPDSPETKYGLGLVYSPVGSYGHSGAHEGYLTIMVYYPKTDVAYVMFTNVWDVTDGLESIKTELNAMMETANKVLKEMGY